MPETEARRDAILRFGNPTIQTERVHAVDANLALEEFVRDVRYALRQLRGAPGCTLSAILSLALGIGANVIVFGVLNALILRPVNVPAAERLFEIVQREAGNDNQSFVRICPIGGHDLEWIRFSRTHSWVY